MRPALIDYLLVVEELELSVELHLFIGRLELGVLALADGRVCFAELPGSTGDAALALLARMPGTRVVAEAWVPRIANVECTWRDVIEQEELASSPGRAWRLDAVREELEELGEAAKPNLPRLVHSRPATELASPLRDVVGLLFDWAAADACLADDIEAAHALLTRRVELCPTELICAANLERLHLRLLADDIATSVAREQS